MKLDPSAPLEGLPDGSRALLDRYQALLEQRAVPEGLISRGDRARLRERHILDSLRALPCLPRSPARVADLGSGAGLPGIPAAIARPDCDVTLVEGRRHRSTFLEWAVASLGLSNVRVFAGRAERAPGPFDVCLARAFARPGPAWDVAEGLLGAAGTLVYFGGSTFSLDQCRDEISGGTCAVCVRPSFPWQGPVVIMGRAAIG